MPPKQALSIGINAYSPSHLVLEPCLNDATDVHNSLRSVGFHTQCELDLDLNSMRSATHHFVRSIRPGSVALFYFSGHGVQSDGNNYLVPANATGICADNISSTAIDAQKLINDMHERRPRLIICILDCCRTDPPREPLDGSHPYKRALAGTRAGFAPMQAPSSTIVVYACAADDTASPRSRNGRNSLYTYHLLRYIRTPNIDVETLFRHVASDVQKDSQNQQIPFRYSSCNEMIYLVGRQGFNMPMPSYGMQAKQLVQPFHWKHRRDQSVPHTQPSMNNFQYPLHGHFGMPIHRYPMTGYPFPHMARVPVGYGFSSPRDLWHYRR